MDLISNIKKMDPRLLFAVLLIIGLIALLLIDATILVWRL